MSLLLPSQSGDLGEGIEPFQISLLIYRIKKILVGGGGIMLKIYCIKDVLKKKKVLLPSYETEVMDVEA